MVRRFFWVFTCGLVIFAFAVAGLAQNESAVKGNISGVVLDSSGAVIPAAKITASGPTGNKQVTTDTDGRFSIPLLTPGTYKLRVEKEGFRSADVQGVEVVVSKTSSVSISMQPGGSNEVVEVSASAVTVDTTSSAVGANLNDTFYSKVPVARNVTGLFYASPGVSSGGGTGAGNPSISGGSGLENQYVADGVNITDGGFGGIGVYTRVYGSLSTGINLSFVKEVQVKTGGFEPQYGKSTGGVVQIVTKSGSNQFHGGVSAFFGPQAFEAERLNADTAGNRLNQSGLLLHQQGYDVSGEIGGYVPGLKNHLFFFGSFNPTWNTQFSQLATLHGVYNYPLVGQDVNLDQHVYNYAAKLTFKISDNHSLESSVFGDPTRYGTGPFDTTSTYSDTTYSTLSNGTRNWVVRYNGTLSPTWLVNSSLSWGHNYLNETPLHPDFYQMTDYTGCGFTGTTPSGSCRTQLINGNNSALGPLSGSFTRQGRGYFENTQGDNWAWNIDTQKVVNKFGSHTFSVGYRYERNYYAGTTAYSGTPFTITPNMAADQCSGASDPTACANGMTGLVSDARFQLRLLSATSGLCGLFAGGCAQMNVPGVGLSNVYLLQDRGRFANQPFNTFGRYHAAYLNDAWTINKYVTVNVGYRWEQQMLHGTPYTDFLTGQAFSTHYTFTDNWSPRIGLAIDPTGSKKTKIFGNFARYSYAIPLDLAIRSLSNELDFGTTAWKPVTDGSNMVVINSDGTLANPVLDDAHYGAALGGVSLSSSENIAPGTKMQYLQEWVAGVEHEFPKGIVVNARWTDRRLKRIVEDGAGISPEAFQVGLAQNYVIFNPGSGVDKYINPIETTYAVGALPASCPLGGTANDFAGNPVADVCIQNPTTAGTLGSDGQADGFWNPVRIYKSLELEINKSFSKGWQMRTNYRWAQLSGNYEGAFRNDNGQSDPSISSLFDFVGGQLGLLGDQAAVGWLNTDRRHIVNAFVSYSFTNGFLKNLTLGTGVRVESGTPISDLRAHPAYQNAGEIPVGGRGSLGRTGTDGQADLHAEYQLKLNEKNSLHFGADLFNITNQKQLLTVDQNQDRSLGVANADFLKPTQGGGLNPIGGYQRPFYARLMVKWVF